MDPEICCNYILKIEKQLYTKKINTFIVITTARLLTFLLFVFCVKKKEDQCVF